LVLVCVWWLDFDSCVLTRRCTCDNDPTNIAHKSRPKPRPPTPATTDLCGFQCLKLQPGSPLGQARGAVPQQLQLVHAPEPLKRFVQVSLLCRFWHALGVVGGCGFVMLRWCLFAVSGRQRLRHKPSSATHPPTRPHPFHTLSTHHHSTTRHTTHLDEHASAGGGRGGVVPPLTFGLPAEPQSGLWVGRSVVQITIQSSLQCSRVAGVARGACGWVGGVGLDGWRVVACEFGEGERHSSAATTQIELCALL